MKKILLLGDIHANYPALKAIVKDICPDRFDLIVNTGDFTVYSTFPNETIQWFRKRKNHLPDIYSKMFQAGKKLN